MELQFGVMEGVDLKHVLERYPDPLLFDVYHHLAVYLVLQVLLIPVFQHALHYLPVNLVFLAVMTPLHLPHTVLLPQLYCICVGLWQNIHICEARTVRIWEFQVHQKHRLVFHLEEVPVFLYLPLVVDVGILQLREAEPLTYLVEEAVDVEFILREGQQIVERLEVGLQLRSVVGHIVLAVLTVVFDLCKEINVKWVTVLGD